MKDGDIMGEKLNVHRTLEVILKRSWVILLAVFASASAAYYYTEHFQTAVYSSTVQIIAPINSQDGQNVNDINTNIMMITTYQDMIKSSVLLDQVRTELQKEKLTYSTEQLRDALRITHMSDSQIFEIEAYDEDPEHAALIVNQTYTVFAKLAKDLMGIKESTALTLGEVNPDPITPNKIKNVAFGGMIGFFLGLGVIIIWDYFDTKRTTKHLLLAEFDFSELGHISKMRKRELIPTQSLSSATKNKESRPPESEKRDLRLISDTQTGGVTGEQYRRLRTRICYEVEQKGTQTIVITSVKPKEGKSTVAVNLAFLCAKIGKRVLLLDGNLRTANLTKAFELFDRPGLSELLMDDNQTPIAVMPLSENLFFLPSGRKITQPSELLSSVKMTRLLKQAKQKFDIILIDTPAIGRVTDGQILAARADGTILVVKETKLQQRDLLDAKETLAPVAANLVGVVFNYSPRK